MLMWTWLLYVVRNQTFSWFVKLAVEVDEAYVYICDSFIYWVELITNKYKYQIITGINH